MKQGRETTGAQVLVEVHDFALAPRCPSRCLRRTGLTSTEAEWLNHQRQERIDKLALALAELRRIRNSGHLAFVASRPCLTCGRHRAHAHHLKFARPTALGRKVSDEFTVPLCSVHHEELHSPGNERVWWAQQGIDALAVAAQLWKSRSDLK